jgi:RNA recognition motif-containing protein
VERVHLPQDREAGQPRGFGFVTMPNGPEAQAAIPGLQGGHLGGRGLRVKEARQREGRGGARRAPRQLQWEASRHGCRVAVAEQRPERPLVRAPEEGGREPRGIDSAAEALCPDRRCLGHERIRQEKGLCTKSPSFPQSFVQDGILHKKFTSDF